MPEQIRCVSVIGAAACSAEEAEWAEELGRLLAEAGFAVVCGGGSGVMEAVCRGAYNADGLTIGILPGSNAAEANPHVRLAIPTGLSHARNVVVVLSGEVVIAVGGAYGTLTEMGYAKKLGKPVIGFASWQSEKADGSKLEITRVETPEEAVELARRLIGRAE